MTAHPASEPPPGIPNPEPAPFDPRAWVLWLLAAFTAAVITKNPWYLLTLLAVAGIVYRRLARRPATGEWRPLLRLGLLLALLAVLFPPLFVKAGETSLLALPALTLELPFGAAPEVVIGGPVSAESVVFGVVTGLALMAILVTFAAFSAAVDPYALLRSMPRFLHRSAAVLSIAVTFVPQMLTAQREIRQAQTLRGHRFRSLRDLGPLFVTLLGEALERSLTLAEALEARGFGRGSEQDRMRPPVQAGLAGALALLLTGAVLRIWAPQRPWGNGALAAGALVLVSALWGVGRRVRRSRLRRQRWERHDTAVAAASAAALTLLAACWVTGRGGLDFYPYPRLGLPVFDPLVAGALVLLAAPAFASGGAERGGGDE